MTRPLSLVLALAIVDAAALVAIAAPPSSAPVIVANTPAQAPTFDPTIEAILRTATHVRLVTSGTLAAATLTRAAERTATPTLTTTPTATTTLPPPFSTVDPCVCLTPRPDSTECANVVATLHAGYREAFASQTALARGTDTATPTATPELPTATATATSTATPAPSASRTATDEPTPTAGVTERSGGVVLLPFAYLRRSRR